MDQLRAMRTFATVVERGSFAAAARALDLAPAVVTRLIAELEGELGARLMTRTTRRLALTRIGESYLERVRAILREVDEAAALVRDSQGRPRGTVRVIAPPTFATCQLLPRLPRLHALHPELSVEVTASGPVETVDEAHDISLVVRHDTLDGDFVAHRLARSRVVLVAAPEHLRRHGVPQHPRELKSHPLLLPVPRMQRGVRFRRTGTEDGDGEPEEFFGAPERVVLSSVNAELSLAGALAGMGITGLPSFAVHDALRQGRLVQVLGDWRVAEVTIWAALPSRRQVPAAVRAMLDFLRREFPGGDADPWLPQAAAETATATSVVAPNALAADHPIRRAPAARVDRPSLRLAA